MKALETECFNNLFISIIMPVRNEANFISRSLQSILSQDFPPSQFEILIVDGMSDDMTREVINTIIQKEISRSNNPKNFSFPTIRILDNPRRIVPSALNIGLQHARGDIIFRVDGHCELPSDYLTRCLKLLVETNADNFGGVLETISDTCVGQAIALATSSFFGVGGSRFRCSKRAGWVDTVFPGVFRREIFTRLGYFDEELVRNQDDEFNFRLLQAGGKIWLDPSIRVIYYSRSNYIKLWKQYFQYGLYKVRVIQKRKGVASWRHLVPGAFVVGLFGSGLLSLATMNFLWLLGILIPYTLANVAASLWTARQHWPVLFFLPAAFTVLHLSYGMGFLQGLWRWRKNWSNSNP